MHHKYLSKINELVATCAGIQFDECHKIYIIMSQKELDASTYPLIRTRSGNVTSEDLSNILLEWYEMSCELRFVNVVNADGSLDSVVPQNCSFAESDE